MNQFERLIMARDVRCTRGVEDNHADPGSRESIESAGCWDPYACLEAFADLIASNFPIDPGLKPLPRGYVMARRRFLELWSRRSSESGELFLEFEREIYRIRSDDIVWNPLFGKLKLIMINVPGIYHGNRFSARSVRIWLTSLAEEQPGESELDSAIRKDVRQYRTIIPFLSVVADLAATCSLAQQTARG